MLALILAIGIPLAYVIAGMFASRAYWFKTRNYPKLCGYYKCKRCKNEDDHYFHCIWSSTMVRPPNAVFIIFLWPLALLFKSFKSFYNAPIKKLEKNRVKIEEEIETLRLAAKEFPNDSDAQKTMLDMVSVKAKELKGMN